MGNKKSKSIQTDPEPPKYVSPPKYEPTNAYPIDADINPHFTFEEQKEHYDVIVGLRQNSCKLVVTDCDVARRINVFSKWGEYKKEFMLASRDSADVKFDLFKYNEDYITFRKVVSTYRLSNGERWNNVAYHRLIHMISCCRAFRTEHVRVMLAEIQILANDPAIGVFLEWMCKKMIEDGQQEETGGEPSAPEEGEEGEEGVPTTTNTLADPVRSFESALESLENVIGGLG